jgi:hypothetical protein
MRVMKMFKVLTLVVPAAVAVLSMPMVKEVSAMTRGLNSHASGDKSHTSANTSRPHKFCLKMFGKCSVDCESLGVKTVGYQDCVNGCWAGMGICEFLALWTRQDERAAAHGVISKDSSKNFTPAGNKLMAGGKGTHAGAATATMDGALSRPKSSAVTNSGVISASGSAVTNSGVGRRGTVAGHPVTGAAGATFRPQ